MRDRELDELRQPDFPIALRGYDRDAVDAYIERVNRAIADLQVGRSPQSAIRHALDQVSEETRGILERAHDTADEIVSRSQAQAAERLARAEREARTAVEAAEARVRALDADADEVWHERKRLIDDAMRVAAEMAGMADAAANRFPPETPESSADTMAIEPPDDAELDAAPEPALAPEPEPDRARARARDGRGSDTAPAARPRAAAQLRRARGGTPGRLSAPASVHTTMATQRMRPSFGNRDIAVDLGTANTLVYVRGEGILVSEPSVVAIDTATNAVHAVGEEAKRMIGRTPATISAIRPLRHGVIADFEVTEQMLRYFIRRVQQRRWARPRVVMCAPSGITEVEKKAVVEASLAAGAREVKLIEEPVAAAIGAGLDIAEPVGNMVVDVGGGTTEVAVLSLGGMVVSESLRMGGYELDEAISSHIRREHRIAIGAQTAEDIKIELGSAAPLQDEMMTVVRGRDLTTGLPKEVHLTSEEVRNALSETVEHIIGAIKDTLERTPPELAADISERGILLAGGGALLGAFTDRVRQETGMPASLAESPLTCVAVGSGMSLEEFDAMERLDRPFERSASRRRLRPSRARAMS